MKNLAPIPANIPVAAVDGTSTSTAFTATVPGIDALFDGVCVLLKNGVVTSASGFTVNINNLGAKPVYSSMSAASAESTIFNINYTLLLVYDSTRISGGCWVNYSGSSLPPVTSSDNGKVLMVVSGAWAAASLPLYNGGVS